MDNIVYVTVQFRVKNFGEDTDRQCREIIREAMDNYKIKDEDITYDEVIIPE